MSHDSFTELDGFVRYFLALDFAHIAPVEFYDFGPVLSLVLYRSAPWQAELFILRPGKGFPRQHRHPDVDAYEYDLDGSIPFIVNGEPGKSAATLGDSRPIYRVESGDWHGVGDLSRETSFLSLQRWNNGRPPSSVGLNWEGAPVSEQHRKLLRQSRTVWVKTIRRKERTCELAS